MTLKRSLALGFVLLVGVATQIQSRASSVDAHGESVLRGVVGLNKEVSLTETKIPMCELVLRISRSTGVNLYTSAEVSDEPVALSVRGLPAHDVLLQLAELFDYRWIGHHSAKGWRYQLLQDSAARQREEALRASELREGLIALRQEVSRVAEAASLTERQLRDALLGLRNQTVRSPNPQAPGANIRHSTTPDTGATDYAQYASQLWSPLNRAMARFLGRFNEAQWELITQTGHMVFSTQPRAGEFPLSPSVLDQFRRSEPVLLPPELRDRPLTPEVEERVSHFAKEAAEDWSRALGYRLSVRVNRDHVTHRILSLEAGASPLLADAKGKQHFASPSSTLELFPLSERQVAEVVRSVANRPDLLKHPVIGRVRKTDALIRYYQGLSQARHTSRGTFTDLVPEVSRLYEVPIVSDAYSYPSSPSITRFLEGHRNHLPLLDVLDNMGRWSYKDGVIQIRNREWPFARIREVPLRLTRRWKRLVEQDGALSLAEYFFLSNSLTETQTQGLLDAALCGLLPEDIANAGPARYALFLYSSLPLTQQQLLWRGARIPVQAMTAQQQKFFSTAVAEQYDWQGDSSPPDLDLSYAHFGIDARPITRQFAEAPKQAQPGRVALSFILAAAPDSNVRNTIIIPSQLR